MQRTIYGSEYAINSKMSNAEILARLEKAELELVKTGKLAKENKQLISSLIDAARRYLTSDIVFYRHAPDKLPEASFTLYSNLIYMATVLDQTHFLLYAKHESAECRYNLFVATVQTFEFRREKLLIEREDFHKHLTRAMMALGLYMMLIDGRERMMGFLLAVAGYVMSLSKGFYMPALVRACYEESLINKLNYHDSSDPMQRAKLKPGLQLTWSFMQDNVIDPLLQQSAAYFYHPASSRRLTRLEENNYLNSYSSLDM